MNTRRKGKQPPAQDNVDEYCWNCGKRSSKLITISELFTSFVKKDSEHNKGCKQITSDIKDQILAKALTQKFNFKSSKAVKFNELCEECCILVFHVYSKEYAGTRQRSKRIQLKTEYIEDSDDEEESESDFDDGDSGEEFIQISEDESDSEYEESDEDDVVVIEDSEEEKDDECEDDEESEQNDITTSESTGRSVRSSEKKRRYVCSICSKCFLRSTHLKNHSVIEHPEQGIECDHKCMICDMEFTRKYNLQRHMKKVHDLSEEKIIRIQTISLKRNKEGYDADEEKKKKPPATRKSNRKSTSKTDVLQIEKEKWLKKSGKRSGKNDFICNICDRIFHRRHYLSRHLQTHISHFLFPCDVCGKSYSRKDTLQTHKRELHSENNYECTVCSKKYGTQRQLNKHMKIHLCKKRPGTMNGKRSTTVLAESNDLSSQS